MPRVFPLRSLVCTLFNKGGSRRASRLPGAGGDHFHCTVEPSPGHIRCRFLYSCTFQDHGSEAVQTMVQDHGVARVGTMQVQAIMPPSIRGLQTHPNSQLSARDAPKDQNKHVQIHAPTSSYVSSEQETGTSLHKLAPPRGRHFRVGPTGSVGCKFG